jgi:hypothetical protein
VPISKYIIELDENDIADCVEATNERIELIKQNRYEHRFARLAKKNDPFNREGHYQAFLTELATARYFGVSYNFDIGPDALRSDLINGCQVRSTRNINGSLIVQEFDKPAPFVLAIPLENDHQILLAGWRDLIDCRLEKYWRKDVPKPAWFVPQSDLHDMVSLRARFMFV